MPLMSTQQRLANLQVLASITPGDKLDVSGNVFTRQKPGLFTSFKRTLSTQSASSYSQPISQLFWEEIVEGLEKDFCNNNRTVRIPECKAAFLGVRRLQETYTTELRRDKNSHTSVDKNGLVGNLITKISGLIKVLDNLPRIFVYNGGPISKTITIPNKLIDDYLDPIFMLKHQDHPNKRSPKRPIILNPNKPEEIDWITESFYEDQNRSQKLTWNRGLLPCGGDNSVKITAAYIKKEVGEEKLFLLSQLLSQAGLVGAATGFIMGMAKKQGDPIIPLFALNDQSQLHLNNFNKYIYNVADFGQPSLSIELKLYLDINTVALTMPLDPENQGNMSHLPITESPLSSFEGTFTFKLKTPDIVKKTGLLTGLLIISTEQALITYSCKPGIRLQDNP